MSPSPRSSAPRAAALACAVVLAATGCYSYVPTERPNPGTTVRVRLPVTSAAADRNAAPETIEVEGTVLSAGDSIVLETQSRRELGTFRVLTDTDTLRVARSGIVGLDEQVFSKGKTFGLTALTVGGVVGLVLAILDAGGGSAGDGGPAPPPVVGGLRLPPVVLKQLLGGLIR